MNWSQVEEQYLREHYRDPVPVSAIAEYLGRPITQVYSKASWMGLRRLMTRVSKWCYHLEEILDIAMTLERRGYEVKIQNRGGSKQIAVFKGALLDEKRNSH